MNNLSKETLEKAKAENRKKLKALNEKLSIVQAELDALIDMTMECRDEEVSMLKEMIGLTKIEKDIYKSQTHELKQELLRLNYQLQYGF